MILRKEILDYINNKCKNGFDPFYVYSSEMIRERCRIFQNIPYKNKTIHFATMANSNPRFLKIVKEEKVNVALNSTLHLEAVQQIGFSSKDIIFTSSALTGKIMQLIHNSGSELNVDSPNQLKLWAQLFPHDPIGIRCNIGDIINPLSSNSGFYIGRESRLGFTREEISQIDNKSIIKGLHLYVGTDIFDLDYFFRCYKELISIAAEFPKIEYLNFGGGFGISENNEKQFDFLKYNSLITELMTEVSYNKGYSIRLTLEPGRIIGGEAGFFICAVTDVKNRSNSLVGVNASIAQFPRPLLYPDIAKHPAMIIRGSRQVLDDHDHSTTIYGCSTYSRDIFSKNIKLPKVQIGDIVVFGNAGSYCASSFIEFLGFTKPSEYFI